MPFMIQEVRKYFLKQYAVYDNNRNKKVGANIKFNTFLSIFCHS